MNIKLLLLRGVYVFSSRKKGDFSVFKSLSPGKQG